MVRCSRPERRTPPPRDSGSLATELLAGDVRAAGPIADQLVVTAHDVPGGGLVDVHHVALGGTLGDVHAKGVLVAGVGDALIVGLKPVLDRAAGVTVVVLDHVAA